MKPSSIKYLDRKAVAKRIIEIARDRNAPECETLLRVQAYLDVYAELTKESE